MKNIGTRIKFLRKHLNKSQEELANILGVTKQAISNMENSKSTPSPAVLYKLHTELDVNLNYIITGVGDLYISAKGKDALRNTILKEVEVLLSSKGIN